MLQDCSQEQLAQPQGSPYLDAFGAGVQGVRPAARALPAPRAAR